jgi:hypothetical protein
VEWGQYRDLAGTKILAGKEILAGKCRRQEDNSQDWSPFAAIRIIIFANCRALSSGWENISFHLFCSLNKMLIKLGLKMPPLPSAFNLRELKKKPEILLTDCLVNFISMI